MNTDTKIEETQKEKTNSKRLSSLIWLLVLWGGVRACSEMDGISWKRAFPSGVVIFGLWPATLFLGLSIVLPFLIYQSVLRWAALLSVLGSFATIFFFNEQDKGIGFIVWEQRVLVFLTLAGIATHWFLKARKND